MPKWEKFHMRNPRDKMGKPWIKFTVLREYMVSKLEEEDARRRLKTEVLKMQNDRKYGQIWAPAQNFISKKENYKSALCSYEMIYL